MTMSVGMKARKKQSTLPQSAPETIENREFESTLLALESAVMRILEKRHPRNADDADLLTWQQRLKNIATPVSLALAEHKGPRRFHNHYRHRKDDEAVLTPVLEDPLDMLAHACETALEHCRADLAGMHEETLARSAQRLENALAVFLKQYRRQKNEQ